MSIPSAKYLTHLTDSTAHQHDSIAELTTSKVSSSHFLRLTNSQRVKNPSSDLPKGEPGVSSLSSFVASKTKQLRTTDHPPRRAREMHHKQATNPKEAGLVENPKVCRQASSVPHAEGHSSSAEFIRDTFSPKGTTLSPT
jgi:hypothetical protein